MKKLVTAVVLSGGVLAASLTLALENKFSPYVDADGSIHYPQDFRDNFVHLGSWVVPDKKAPGHGFHDVYTEPGTVEYFRKNGRFPDGAILIKEIRALLEAPHTTGQATWAGENKVWFVMVKDEKNRFPGNSHWEEGWGWALYEAKQPTVNVSRGFKQECMACHLPAKKNDWVFTEGYPRLR